MHVICFVMGKLYFMKDVVKITGINQPKLQQWLRDGFIQASIKGEGSGTRNQFDFSNLCEIKLFSILIENGISRLAAAKQISSMPPLSLYEDYPEEAGYIITLTDLKTKQIGTYAVIAGSDEFESIKDAASQWVPKGFDMITLYSLKRIIQDINDGIARSDSSGN